MPRNRTYNGLLSVYFCQSWAGTSRTHMLMRDFYRGIGPIIGTGNPTGKSYQTSADCKLLIGFRSECALRKVYPLTAIKYWSFRATGTGSSSKVPPPAPGPSGCAETVQTQKY